MTLSRTVSIQAQKSECLYAINRPSAASRSNGSLFEECVVTIDVVGDLGLIDQNAIDPPLRSLRLLGELGDLVAADLEVAVACRRMDRGERAELAVILVEGDQCVEIDRRHAVAPGDQERAGSEVRNEFVDAPAGVRVPTSLDESHRPVFDIVPVRHRLDDALACGSSDPR